MEDDLYTSLMNEIFSGLAEFYPSIKEKQDDLMKSCLERYKEVHVPALYAALRDDVERAIEREAE